MDITLPKNQNFIDSSSSITEIWAKVNDSSNKFELELPPEFRRSTGSYYTDLELAKYMVDELFNSVDEKFISNLKDKYFLEPCVGTGNFVFAYLKKLYELSIDINSVKEIIKKIYVCDTNTDAINLYKLLFEEFVFVHFGINLESDFFEGKIAFGLLFDVSENIPRYKNIQEVFPDFNLINGFDIVITNPPYKNLKAEKTKYLNEIDYIKDKERYGHIAKIVKNIFKLSNRGVLNLYKLFTEEIISKYSNENAVISILVPSSILSDMSCERLRTHILNENNLISVNVIRENNRFINAQQSLTTMLIHKNSKTKKIKINKDFCNESSNSIEINLENVINPNTGNSIFAIGDQDYKVLNKLREFKCIKELPFILNKRGELDLSINSKSITKELTLNELLRGRHINFYFLNNLDKKEYTEKEFINNSTKKKFVFCERIACQQVVNINKERRVAFSFVREGYVLANSCNFLSVEPNIYKIDLYYLLGLLNSPIINWYFKLTSSNNHINNYEIDSFPIPLDKKYIKEISELVRMYLKTKDMVLLEKINLLVDYAYGLKSGKISNKETEKNKANLENAKVTEDELTINYASDMANIIYSFSENIATSILTGKVALDTVLTSTENHLNDFYLNVSKLITEKYKKIMNNEILNHTTFKLSKLDLDMVKAVPQGGNWKNIPQEIVLKSQRLIRISETGGRTTLYGRIDYNKPSYTITTYFNRPGNGTYIHPIFDRVLSVREAARFQSFKDDYYFVGNKKDILKQVGNAIPPLLSFQIGKKIVEKTSCRTSLDLFCGAGGLTAGFKEAGLNCVLGTDFDLRACLTFKINNPENNVLCGDISDPGIKQEIIDVAKKNSVDIICGGPPCQGFSLAGKRFEDDPRNKLFKHFVEVVAAAKPKIVVMENVEGLLSFQKGKIYKQIIELFTDLNYITEGRILLASEYGIPQKRKRLIIICVRKDLEIFPNSLFPEKTTKKIENQITAKEAISDLEPIECGEDAKYINSTKLSSYAKEMRSFLPFGYSVTEKVISSDIEIKIGNQLSLF